MTDKYKNPNDKQNFICVLVISDCPIIHIWLLVLFSSVIIDFMNGFCALDFRIWSLFGIVVLSFAILPIFILTDSLLYPEKYG